jgi:hypothetical protein
MDAGLAGLIGALGGGFIGAVGATVAAQLAYRGARDASERQAQALREEWLRQQRRDAYVNFYNAARVLYLLLRETAYAATNGSWEPPEQARQTVRVLGDASGVLAMEATQRILDEADSLSTRLATVYSEIRDFDPGVTNPELRAKGRDWYLELRSIFEESEVWLVHCREELHH